MDKCEHKALHKRVKRYLKAVKRVKQDTSPKAIHEFRLASRNLLAVEPLLRTAGKHGNWHKKVKRWLKVLNKLRDLQVMQERLHIKGQLETKLQHHVDQAMHQWKQVRSTLANRRFKKQLKRSVQAFLQRSQTYPGYFSVTTLSLWWTTLGKMQNRLDAVQLDDPTTLHHLRIAYKSLRYLVNTLRDMQVVAENVQTDLKQWHEVLGDIQDRQVASVWLKQQEATQLASEQIQQAQQLIEHFGERQAQFRQTLTQLDATVTHCLLEQLYTLRSDA